MLALFTLTKATYSGNTKILQLTTCNCFK